MKNLEQLNDALWVCRSTIDRLEKEYESNKDKEVKNTIERFRIRLKVLEWAVSDDDAQKEHIIDWI